MNYGKIRTRVIVLLILAIVLLTSKFSGADDRQLELGIRVEGINGSNAQIYELTNYWSPWAASNDIKRNIFFQTAFGFRSTSYYPYNIFPIAEVLNPGFQVYFFNSLRLRVSNGFALIPDLIYPQQIYDMTHLQLDILDNKSGAFVGIDFSHAVTGNAPGSDVPSYDTVGANLGIKF